MHTYCNLLFLMNFIHHSIPYCRLVPTDESATNCRLALRGWTNTTEECTTTAAQACYLISHSLQLHQIHWRIIHVPCPAKHNITSTGYRSAPRTAAPDRPAPQLPQPRSLQRTAGIRCRAATQRRVRIPLRGAKRTLRPASSKSARPAQAQRVLAGPSSVALVRGSSFLRAGGGALMTRPRSQPLQAAGRLHRGRGRRVRDMSRTKPWPLSIPRPGPRAEPQSRGQRGGGVDVDRR
jgi:hypothetical protein